RSASPPASAYFSTFTGDHHMEPQPNTPEASAHFAYSTTLRRHHPQHELPIAELRQVVAEEGPKGVWER
ncbi:hypothetical protein K474DRAFT_1560332, partial [Panus rudis PR-1116 ss-1]